MRMEFCQKGFIGVTIDAKSIQLLFPLQVVLFPCSDSPFQSIIELLRSRLLLGQSLFIDLSLGGSDTLINTSIIASNKIKRTKNKIIKFINLHCTL